MRFVKIVGVITLGLSLVVSTTNVDAKGGGSRSSSSRSSFSRSSSTPKYSAPKPSTPKPSTPKYSAPAASKPSTPKYSAPAASKPSTPKYSAPAASKPSTPKYSAPASSTTGNSGSNKVGSAVGGSAKAQANKNAASERKYVESTKATAPPKSSYTTSDGKQAAVRTDSKHVDYIRNQPTSRYTPEARQQASVTHVTQYNYQHPYDHYYSQPSFFVGGGYSSAFWWMMSEWSAERRAQWLYHNQNNIEKSAYERGMKDAEVAKHLAELQAKKVAVNPDYVDKEFEKDPSLMYEDAYIKAAYNPTIAAPMPAIVTPKPVSFLSHVMRILMWSFVVAVISYILYLLIFVKKWGS